MPFDYLTLMLVNMVGGLVVLGVMLLRWSNEQGAMKKWAPAFAVVGFIAVATGLHMTLTWPLSGGAKWANMAFGEPTVLLGALFLGGALALAKEWKLDALAIYAVFAGASAIAVGVGILQKHLTQAPMLSAVGFFLTGAGAILVLPSACCGCRGVRIINALVLFAAAGIWAMTGYMAIVMHIINLAPTP
jgi:putative membrane protein